MGSLEVAAHAIVNPVVEAFSPMAPQMHGLCNSDACSSIIAVPELLPNVEAGWTFPHFAFLPEPPKGSLRQQFLNGESNCSWDVHADRELLLSDALQPIDAVEVGTEIPKGNDFEPSAALSSLRERSVRLMQLRHRDHPARFRLQLTAAASSWEQLLQRMTALSDSTSLSKIMSLLRHDCGSVAGIKHRADTQSQHVTKRGCFDWQKCRHSCERLEAVSWREELRYLYQEEVPEIADREQPSIIGCALSESDSPCPHEQIADNAYHVEFSPIAAGLSESPTLTDEQKAIIELADPNLPRPPCVRVVAAAGTGKTTTLVHIVRRLRAEAPHKRILYLVYNKEFQVQAQVTLGSAVQCLTLDACAGRYGAEDAVKGWQRLEEKVFMARAQDTLRREIDSMPWIDDSKREQNAPNAETQKLLMVKWILKTLDIWMQKSLDFAQIFATHTNGKVRVNNQNRCFVHYPCFVECAELLDSRTGTRSNRLPSLSRECRRGRSTQWYMDKAMELWQAMEDGKFAPVGCSGSCGTHGFWMKKAQLLSRAMPFDVILLDEAQDVTECQLTWAIQRQKHAMRFCVGDPCQRIYGFRGAIFESDFEIILRAELTCKPMLLSHSFRFGLDIARVANAMLFVRFNLKISQNDSMRIKYQIHGKSTLPCVAVHSSSPEAAQLLRKTHTLIARTNLQLFKEVLELWEKDQGIKIHVNGTTTRLKFQTCLKEIEAAFPLYAASTGAQYKKFSSWVALRRFAESQHDETDDDTSALLMMVCIIETYRDQTLAKCDNFKRALLDSCRADEADVIVTTTHQAKGMEFHTVRLCDDFADLSVFEKNEATFRVSPDDMNLWYVAVTRARQVVVLPPKFMELACKICETLDDCASTTVVDGATPMSVSLRARAKLFHNWPLPLLVQPSDVPLSPVRARSIPAEI